MNDDFAARRPFQLDIFEPHDGKKVHSVYFACEEDALSRMEELRGRQTHYVLRDGNGAELDSYS